jgi:hypothetical protein
MDLNIWHRLSHELRAEMKHVASAYSNYRSGTGFTADQQAQKRQLPKCCPLVSKVSKRVQMCPKEGVRNR